MRRSRRRSSSSERVAVFVCAPTKDEVVPFAGEEQLNVSPTVAAARRRERNAVWIYLIATDDNIKYCDRNAIVGTLGRLDAP